MLHTTLSTTDAATLCQRVTGLIDMPTAEEGAASARQIVQQASQTQGPLNLLLDLRGLHFDTLQAHKAWRVGFTQHPLVAAHVRYVAIIGDDTPTFRAEQAALTTNHCHFFFDPATGQAWLAQASLSEHPFDE